MIISKWILKKQVVKCVDFIYLVQDWMKRRVSYKLIGIA